MGDNKQAKKVKISTIVYAAIIIVVAYVIVIGVALYGFGVENNLVARSARIIPYPAARIGFEFIRWSEVKDNLAAIRKFYESQDFSKVGLRVDFSTEDGQKRLKVRERQLIQRLIEDRAIEILAKERGIKITSELIDQAVSRKLDEYGSRKETQEKLAQLYGWSLQDFKEKIVKPDLYRDELTKKFAAEDKSRETAKAKIEKAKKELDASKNFAEIAKKYSEGKSAADGGGMGWFQSDQLIAGLAEKVFAVKVGETTGIIETELGFHIVKVEERKKEEDLEMAKISQIFVKKNNFADWLAEKIKERKINVLLKNYYWDQANVIVQYKSAELQKFEKELEENFSGDASVMY